MKTIQGPNHAHLCGLIAGALIRDIDVPPAEQVQIERDEGGNYTNRIFITRPDGIWVVTVEPHEVDQEKL